MKRAFWSLNKLVVLVLLGGFALLLVQIRYDHQHVLSEHKIAWTPIVYSGLMLLVGLASLIWWERGGRRLLFWVFAAALVVGPTGFWFHSLGKPLPRLEQEFAVWAQPLGQHEHDEAEAAEPGDEADDEGMTPPPLLAPLSFFGLGLLGMLVCARRAQTGGTTARTGL